MFEESLEETLKEDGGVHVPKRSQSSRGVPIQRKKNRGK